MARVRQTIKVKHNVEMGHRLSLQPDSKCFQLHGHSWWAHLSITGQPDDKGMVLEFGRVKKEFRSYLDGLFDHHLVLNVNDPLVNLVNNELGQVYLRDWGIVTVNFDPTVENMARCWGEHMRNVFGHQYGYQLELWEAATNCAIWEG